MLSELEKKALKECCELNENISLNIKEKGKIYVYKSRFLEIDFKRKYIIIDMPSAETHDAQPMAKGEHFEAFFTYKTFRYLFPSQILDHTRFKMQQMEIHAAKIFLPTELQDGDKREYFRVQVAMRPPVQVKFNIYEKNGDTPIMSKLVANSPKEFQAQMMDISGGGFSLKTTPGEKGLSLEKGDVINAKFRLKKGMEEMEIWSEVRNKRKYRETEMMVWGLQFIEDAQKNRYLKHYRNKIMRYVVERQREMLFK